MASLDLENQNLQGYDASLEPSFETVRELLVRKRREGDPDRKVTVKATYLLDLLEFHMSGTSFTYQMFHDAPRKLKEYETNMLKAQADNQQLRQKVSDLLVENSVLFSKVDEVMNLQKDRELSDAKEEVRSRIIKLPIRKINSFLMFSDTKDDKAVFYIKLDKDGNMERINTNAEEIV